jgi:tetratricopeptide (TPR) repeat protein
MPILAYLHVKQHYLEERILWEHRITLFRQLFDHDPLSLRHAGDLAESLFNYGVCLHHGNSRVADECAALAEAVGFRRLLYNRDERYRGDLANTLHNYGISLGESGRVLDACKAEEETVALRRQMYEREPLSRRYRSALAHSLYNYGLSLAEADSEGTLDCIEDACSVLKECVWLRREQLIDRASASAGAGAASTMNSPYRDRWGLELAMALHAYGWVLHCAGRYDDARAVKEETVAVIRTSPAHRRADLAAALHNLGSTLHHLGKIEEACDAYREAVAIRRRDFELDLRRYQADYEQSLHDLNICAELLRSQRPV